ncbi:DNA-binding transcriptional regulator, AcrR family [Nakamurella panacisegetis]|uniref:DNA-binding transcriptional regulator, AcrR family n=1 Tax=Nakamurella panacisegetis TaxID=1090615 RepID=A0A1H0LDM3_9ACTN|nr:TetR/AcrR family transcriptional regulator [Nakamurella panacisegetis]SDO66215.1 DNA-binding transcriptional regulator, AcrR family [Nakamurella panacisegetis]
MTTNTEDGSTGGEVPIAGPAGGRVRPGRPRSQERRSSILAAAGELMLEGGLPAATMEAIAARAGVSKATIYKWWPSRGAVALEGFMVAVADTWSLSTELSTRDALYGLVQRAVQLFSQGPAGPLMRALAAEAQSQPDIAQALREHWFGPRRALAAVTIRRGIDRGELRADLDVPMALDGLFAPIYYRLLFSHEPLDDDFARQLVQQLLAGISGPGISRGPSS